MKNLLYEFENSSDADKKEEISIEVPDAAKAEFKFESGFEYCGNYTGGRILLNILLHIHAFIDVGVSRFTHLVCKGCESIVHRSMLNLLLNSNCSHILPILYSFMKLHAHPVNHKCI